MEACATPGAGEEMSAEAVAELLETVYRANARLAAAVDAIVGWRTSVNLALLDRFTWLGADLRPGAQARARLADLDPSALLAGVQLWVARTRAAEGAAHHRADRRWLVGGGS